MLKKFWTQLLIQSGYSESFHSAETATLIRYKVSEWVGAWECRCTAPCDSRQQIHMAFSESWWEIYWKPLSARVSISIKSSSELFFSLHCPHFMAEGLWQMLHNHTYPGEIWMHLLLLATAWNGTWCEMAFCMHFHSNVRLCSFTHLPLGESVFIWPGPFLYSYFILLDKGSEGEEGQSEDRLGHYKPHGKDF